MAVEDLISSSGPVLATTVSTPNSIPLTDSMGDLNAFTTTQSATATPSAIPLGSANDSLYGWGAAKNNLTATTDPDINTDSTLGYQAGSLWLNTTAGTENHWVCVSSTKGAARWTLVSQNPGTAALGNLQTYNSQRTHFLGNYNDYYRALASTVGSLWFHRNWLNSGTVITKMEACVNSTVNTANLNLGIYSEVNFNPSKLVALTGGFAMPASGSQFITQALLSSWTVPVSDYYWFALVCDSVTPTFFVSTQVILPIISRLLRGQTITGTTMPDTATPLVTNSSNLFYIAAV